MLEWLKTRGRAVLVVSVVVAGLAGLVTPAAHAAEAPVVLRARDWFNGGGVAVCGKSTAESCDSEPHVGGVSENWWQCVELAQRFYQAKGWHRGPFDVNLAYQIYDRANALGMAATANGSITAVAPGDMVIHHSDTPGTKQAGHVAIIESISPTTVTAVQQNARPARITYRFSNRRLSGGVGGTIRGIVHDPDNHLRSSGSTEGTIAVARNADGRLELFGIGLSNELYRRSQNSPGGSWSPWSQMDGGVSNLTAATNQDGRLELFAVGLANDLYHRWQLSPGGNWSPWSRLDGGIRM